LVLVVFRADCFSGEIWQVVMFIEGISIRAAHGYLKGRWIRQRRVASNAFETLIASSDAGTFLSINGVEADDVRLEP